VTLDQQSEIRPLAVPRSWWWMGLVGLLVAALLPVMGHAWRVGRARCEQDGQTIDPTFLVTLVERDGLRRVFCCLACAERWLQRSKAMPDQVLVTDEVTGQPLNAADAYYVRSSVASNAPTGDRRHVFGRREVAQSHAKSFHGRILTGDDRPFSDLPSLSPAVEASQDRPAVEAFISS